MNDSYSVWSFTVEVIKGTWPFLIIGAVGAGLVIRDLARALEKLYSKREVKEVVKLLFHRYAAADKPSDDQIDNAISDIITERGNHDQTTA